MDCCRNAESGIDGARDPMLKGQVELSYFQRNGVKAYADRVLHSAQLNRTGSVPGNLWGKIRLVRRFIRAPFQLASLPASDLGMS
jgi:hypothetical protein